MVSMVTSGKRQAHQSQSLQPVMLGALTTSHLLLPICHLIRYNPVRSAVSVYVVVSEIIIRMVSLVLSPLPIDRLTDASWGWLSWSHECAAVQTKVCTWRGRLTRIVYEAVTRQVIHGHGMEDPDTTLASWHVKRQQRTARSLVTI